MIATSSEEKQLKLIEKGSGVPWRELVDETTMASDVERSKPAPDVVAAAVKKLRMSSAQCAMVGDTPYDAESSKHAGVVCLGVTCGGHPVETLVHSGAAPPGATRPTCSTTSTTPSASLPPARPT